MAGGLDMGTAIRSFLLLLAPAILYAKAGIVSLRPLYTPETAVLNPAIVDLWSSTGHDSLFHLTFRALAYFRGKGITQEAVAVGITQVRLAGGIEWNLPLEAKGRFEGEGDKDLERKIEALQRKAFGRHDASIFFDPSPQRKVSTCRE
jgi:hypothetical protein